MFLKLGFIWDDFIIIIHSHDQEKSISAWSMLDLAKCALISLI